MEQLWMDKGEMAVRMKQGHKIHPDFLDHGAQSNAGASALV